MSPVAAAMMMTIGAIAGVLAVVGTAQAQTLKAVKDRGTLVCGVSEGLAGFSAKDAKGAWSGFDVDFCRALAAAIFDDPSKVQFVPLNAESRFASLQSGAIDMLSRNSTWTMARETELKLIFPAVTYYDGQGFLVRRSPPVQSALNVAFQFLPMPLGQRTLDACRLRVNAARDLFEEVPVGAREVFACAVPSAVRGKMQASGNWQKNRGQAGP